MRVVVLKLVVPALIALSLCGCGGNSYHSSLAITPSSASLHLGDTQQFTATATMSDNTVVDVTSSVTWSTDSPRVATVRGSGAATGRSVGSTNLVATLGSLTGTASISVAAYTARFAYTQSANSLHQAEYVSVFSFDAGTGRLSLVGTFATPLLCGPLGCDTFRAGGLTIQPNGSFAYANGNYYLSGLSIDRTTGTVSLIPGASISPHLSGPLVIDPTGKFLFSGAGNGIASFAIGNDGFLSPISGSPTLCCQIYSITVHPSGKFLYGSVYTADIVGIWAIGADGALSYLGGVPATYDPSGLAVDPTGSYLYVGSQVSAAISSFSIDRTSGALSPIGSGTPATHSTSMAADPSGRFLFVATSGFISVYAINLDTGVLTPVAGSPFIAGRDVRYISVDPSGRFLYASDWRTDCGGCDRVLAFSIDAATGALTSVGSSPVSTESISYTQTNAIVFLRE